VKIKGLYVFPCYREHYYQFRKSSPADGDFPDFFSKVLNKMIPIQDIMPGEKYHRFALLVLFIGTVISLGDYWKFIEHSQKFGISFLIAYAVSLLLIGLPIIMLELGIGIRHRPGILGAFLKTGYFRGLGLFVWIIGILAAVYYSVMAAWSIIYFFVSFGIPWKSNPPLYFQENVLQLSPYIWRLGTIVLPVFIALLIGWVGIFFTIKNGAKTLKRSFMILLPLAIILIVVFLIQALTTDGSLEGISHFLDFRLNSFYSLMMWKSAAINALFSIGIGLGLFITLSANAKKVSAMSCSLAAIASKIIFTILISLAAFGSIGILAKGANMQMENFEMGGLGSQFITFPGAIISMSMPTLSSLILFLSLSVISILAAASIVHFLSSAISSRFKIPHQKSAIMVCGAGFIIGILFTTKSGYYFMDLLEHFVYSYGILIIAMLECIIAGWMCKSWIKPDNIKQGSLWKLSVRFFVPAVLIILLFILLFEDISSFYSSYPLSAMLAAWSIVVVPLVIAFIASRKR